MSRRSTPEYFWSLFDKTGDCWLWTRATNSYGYGIVMYQGEFWLVHRLACYLITGSDLKGLEVDHLCRNRPCGNPQHLEIVSHLENMRRSAPFSYQLGKTHCPKGHEYTPENTALYYGRRNCRMCRRIYSREYYGTKDNGSQKYYYQRCDAESTTR